MKSVIRKKTVISPTIVIASIMLASGIVSANTIGTVPFNDSFEGLADGESIVGSNGWYAATNTYATATNTTYVYSKTRPLADPHNTFVVLDTENGSLSNVFNEAGTASDNVWLDMMLYPTRWTDDAAPDASALDIDVVIFINSNGNPVVYHDADGLGTNNVFTTNTAYTVADSNWVRLTIQGTNLGGFVPAFSFRFDGNPAVTNALGFADDLNPGGPWFVSANPYAGPRGIHCFELSGTGFFDDFVVTDSAPVFSIMWAITASIRDILGADTGGFGGSIAPNGTVMVNQGVTSSVSISVSNFWDAVVVVDGTVAPGSPALITFSNVVADHTVAVTVTPQVVSNPGIPDVPKWWLDAYIGNTNASDALADTDGDGMDNWQEWFTSTDPNDIAQKFEILNHYLVDGTNYVVWVSKNIDPSLPPFRMLRSTNLIAGSWTVVDDNISRGLGTGGTNLWEELNPVGGTTGAFYRVEATNAP